MSAQPGQRQWWLGAARQDDVNHWWQVVQQEGQRLMDGRIFDQMIIVENENQVIGSVDGGIGKRGQYSFAIRRHRAEQHLQRAFPDLRLNLLPSCQQVAEEAIRVIILHVNREPDNCQAACVRPCSERGSLAIACGGGDQRQLGALDALLEDIQEVGAVYQLVRLRWDSQLG